MLHGSGKFPSKDAPPMNRRGVQTQLNVSRRSVMYKIFFSPSFGRMGFKVTLLCSGQFPACFYFSLHLAKTCRNPSKAHQNQFSATYKSQLHTWTSFSMPRALSISASSFSSLPLRKDTSCSRRAFSSFRPSGVVGGHKSSSS